MSFNTKWFQCGFCRLATLSLTQDTLCLCPTKARRLGIWLQWLKSLVLQFDLVSNCAALGPHIKHLQKRGLPILLVPWLALKQCKHTRCSFLTFPFHWSGMIKAQSTLDASTPFCRQFIWYWLHPVWTQAFATAGSHLLAFASAHPVWIRPKERWTPDLKHNFTRNSNQFGQQKKVSPDLRAWLYQKRN